MLVAKVKGRLLSAFIRLCQMDQAWPCRPIDAELLLSEPAGVCIYIQATGQHLDLKKWERFGWSAEYVNKPGEPYRLLSDPPPVGECPFCSGHDVRLVEAIGPAECQTCGRLWPLDV